MARPHYPRNRWISNGGLAELYLRCLRAHIPIADKLFSLVLGTQIMCRIPDRLFIPHPFGIIVSSAVELGNDVVLMQQVTIGGKDPYFNEPTREGAFPKLLDGVYVGAGAKVLGPIIVGEWAIIGANAVVTRDVPPGATVVGANHILTQRQNS